MTVCIGSIAASGGMIVCVADKALTYGVGADEIVWASDSSKIVTLDRTGTVALSAGTEGPSARFLRKLQATCDFRGPIPEIITVLEAQFGQCVEEVQDIEVLRLNGLSRQEYVQALSEGGNDLIAEIRTQMMSKARSYDCEMLICGYSGHSSPYLLHIGPPGAVTDFTNIGFHAVGSGAQQAISRFLSVDHERSDGVVHTLFDCFDAKASAEIMPSVSYEWDACFIQAGSIGHFPPEGKRLLDRAWADRNRSPFRKLKKDDPDRLPKPPRDWQMRLRGYVADVLPGSVIDDVMTIVPTAK